MKPISWHKQEQLLNRTEIEGVDYVLPVVAGKYENGQVVIISCWQISFKELLKLFFTRKIYVSVLSEDIPPIAACVSLECIGVTNL
jgi:hypothetical protein